MGVCAFEGTPQGRGGAAQLREKVDISYLWLTVRRLRHVNEAAIAKPEHRIARGFGYAGDQVIQLSGDFAQIVFAERLFIIMIDIVFRTGDGRPFRQSVGFDLIHRRLDDVLRLIGEISGELFPGVVRAAINPLIPALGALVGKSMSGVLKAFEKPLHQSVDPRLTLIVIRRFVLETEIDVLQELVRARHRLPDDFRHRRGIPIDPRRAARAAGDPRSREYAVSGPMARSSLPISTNSI